MGRQTQMLKVLFIGAHPDDIDFGCAISLQDYFLKGAQISTIILSEGEKGCVSSNRLKEQINSLKIIAPGSENIFFNFPDTQLTFYRSKIISEIKPLILNNIPDIIYIPTSHDYHQDHITTHECFSTILNHVNIGLIICYETPSTTPSFTPNYFKICTPKKFNMKLSALKCHESQLGKTYFSEETVLSIARMRATQGRYYGGLAEAYEIIRCTELSLLSES